MAQCEHVIARFTGSAILIKKIGGQHHEPQSCHANPHTDTF